VKIIIIKTIEHKMAYKYQYNPGIQDSQSLRSAKSNRSRNGTLIRNEALVR
jgi:hypothetical protein